MRLVNYIQVLIFIAVCELAGGVGSIFTSRSIPAWYAGLEKSPLNPPSWVFGPVWTTLFALMGVSAYLLWRRGWQNSGVQTALVVFIVQLVLNVLWSVVFFGFKSPGWALVEIAFLWFAIAVTFVTFYRISHVSAWLLVPYLLWVTFAAYLNYGIWKLN